MYVPSGIVVVNDSRIYYTVVLYRYNLLKYSEKNTRHITAALGLH